MCLQAIVRMLQWRLNVYYARRRRDLSASCRRAAIAALYQSMPVDITWL